MIALALLALALAALPAGLALANLALLRHRPAAPLPADALVSVLIPARNEEANIRGAVTAALASRGVAVEVVVMDDASTDRTAAVVAEMAADDPRVRLEQAPALPPGWTGKVHACQRLAERARGTHLLFVDADVRLEPEAAATLAGYAAATGAALVSGVPRQVTPTWGERLTVPMINFLMLGYLPFGPMRRLNRPSLGAGCGQLMLAEAAAYRGAGGHAAIRTSLHDGVKLPRRFREAGFSTDVVRGADLARCRMYAGLPACWAGFSKNAHEGLATPLGLPVWTLLLFGGHVLPWPLLAAGLLGALPLALAAAPLVLSLGTRALITRAVGETWWSVPLHPLIVLVTLAIQWTALVRVARHGPSGWKGRLYPAE